MKGKISYWIQCALDQPSKGVAFVKAIQRSRQYFVQPSKGVAFVKAIQRSRQYFVGVDVDDRGLVEQQTRIEFG